jgi:hypothetical protein
VVTVSPPRFWHLEAPDSQRRGVEIDGRKYTPVICPTNPGHRRARRGIGNLAIEIPPAGIKDFTWSWENDILLSQRVLDLFAKYSVSGFEVRRAEVFFPKSAKAKPPELFDLVVTGWGGMAAPEAGVKLIKY